MKKIFLLLLFVGMVTSCTTYYIPVNSLKEQFAGIDSTKLINVTVKGPYYDRYHYLAHPLTIIQCVDKKGNPCRLINSPSIEMRITYGRNNKKTVFYFDRIYVDSNSVKGIKSRFIDSIRGSVPLDSITQIEIQDGRKKFEYVE